MQVTSADDRDRLANSDVDIIDVEFVADDASLAGLLRIDSRRTAGATRFLAAVLRPGLDPVVVIDHDLPLARNTFEYRSSGVWVELCCEEPLEHWTVGLEAFGLGLAAGSIASPASFGNRVPVGLDLDLDTIEAAHGVAESFSLGLRVHGEVLIGDTAYEIEATGVRRRRTDGIRPSSPVVAVHPPLRGELSVQWPAVDGGFAVERRGWFGGSIPGWTALLDRSVTDRGSSR